MESPCECGIEPTGSISHGVSISTYIVRMNVKRMVKSITDWKPLRKKVKGQQPRKSGLLDDIKIMRMANWMRITTKQRDMA